MREIADLIAVAIPFSIASERLGANASLLQFAQLSRW